MDITQLVFYPCVKRNNMKEILITEESYNKTFKSLFDSFEINQNYIFQTEIELPFEIPVPDGYVILSPLSERKCYWSMLYFTSKDYHVINKNFDKETTFPSKKTLVNLCVIGDEFNFDSYKVNDVDFELSNEHSYFFNKSLEHLNATIMAYSIYSQDEYAFELTKYDLAPTCVYELIKTDDWKIDNILFILHHTIDTPLKELSPQQSNALNKFSNHLIVNDYIFMISEKYMLMSKNKLNKGQFSESVIFAQIAIEVKIKRIYYYFLKKEGLPKDQIIDALENIAFMSIIKKEIFKRLGGIWDITKPDSIIKEWYDKCYSLRNRVIHVGYTPALQETNLAVNGARNFALYITDLIRQRKKEYPELMRNVEIEL